MSSKSKNSKAAQAAADDPARPFDPAIWAEAERIAADYEIVMWFEEGEWYGHGLELPNTYGDGKTPAVCIRSVRAGLVATVACMLEDGERPPVPAREGARTEQINIRLTPAEKARLENRSRAGGFRGLSDFVRTKALSTAD
jgi:predicted RNase H-like HicB family nuclease